MSRLTRDQTTNAAFGNHDYQYGYDPAGNTTSSNENGPVTSAFDAVNRLQSSSVGGAVTTYSYDGTGNLTKVQEPTGAPVTMSYDNENRLRVHSSASTVTTYAYQWDGMKRTEPVGASGRLRSAAQPRPQSRTSRPRSPRRMRAPITVMRDA